MPDANPVFDLGNPTWMEVVKVAQTPKDLEQYAGRIVGIPATATMPPLGTRGIVLVSGVSVPGYLRQGANGYEWVMMPPVDPIEALVDSLPGLAGWADPQARKTWLDTGIYLRGVGVTLTDLDTGLRNLFNAARTQLAAEAAKK